MESVKEKISISSSQEKIKLLTLVPPSWTIKDSSSYFGVPESMIKKARKLKSEKGLLAEPNKKLGKKISEDMVKCILDFYQFDEYSRCCPRKKEFVSVTTDGVKCHKQKHLLLINLKELHLAFLNTTNHKIGFSKFFQLRLKWCVTVDSTSGVHAVCVCEIHQNAKLLHAAIPGKTDYKEFLSKFVCNTNNNRSCVLHSCDCCPNLNEVEKYILNLFEESNFGTEDSVNFKQWMQKERRISLVNCTLTIEELVKEICNKFNKLRAHHFIAKAQSP